MHKVLFVPSKGLFPQSYVSSDGSIGGINLVGLMVTSSKRAYAIPRSAAPRAPALQQSTADLYLLRRHYSLKGRSDSVSVGSPGAHKVLLEPFECLWRVWGLILNIFHPLHGLAGAFPLPLDVGYLFLVGSNILLSMVVQ